MFEATYGLECKYLVAENEDQIVGILPLVEIAGLFSGRRWVSLPFLDRGGALCRTEEVAEVLFDAALELVESSGAQGLDLRGGAYPAAVQSGEGGGRSHRLSRRSRPCRPGHR